MKNEIILFENQNVKLEVNMKDETVWLSQDQMAKLFGKAKSTINEHIKNIYKEEECLKEQTMTKFGNSEFNGKPTYYYNLDVIISVGYRVKSQNGIIFRKWASQILKDYMIKGYAVNQKRLEYLEKTVKLIDIANRIDEKLNNGDARTNLSNQVVKEVKRYFEDKVYKNVIPRNVKLSEAPSYGMPITLYDPRSKGAKSYEKFTREFLKINEEEQKAAKHMKKGE